MSTRVLLIVCIAAAAAAVELLIIGTALRALTSNAKSRLVAAQAAPKTAPRPGPKHLASWIGSVRNEKAPALLRESNAKQIVTYFPTAPEAKEATAYLEQIARRGDWSYSEHIDSMTDRVVKTATVQSETLHVFSFPYQGAQRALLMLRRHPVLGRDVVLAFERGQILCHVNDCTIRVRFDKGPVLTYQGTRPKDGSTNAVFIPAYPRFQKALPHASIVRVGVDVYREGHVVSEFKVEGFDPSRLD